MIVPTSTKPKPKPEHLLGNLGILVEARRKTDWRREVDAGDRRPEGIGELRGVQPGHQPQPGDGQSMRRLGIERERQWADAANKLARNRNNLSRDAPQG